MMPCNIHEFGSTTMAHKFLGLRKSHMHYNESNLPGSCLSQQAADIVESARKKTPLT